MNLFYKDHFNMKHPLILLIALSLSGCASQEPKIAIFCDHIEAISHQENIPFAEAAAQVRRIGYSGVDVFTTQDPRELEILDSLGFRHSCAVARINYSSGDQEEDERNALDFLVKHGYTRVLLVPGLLDEDCIPEDISVFKARVARFVSKAKALGIDTTLEDFDNMRSPVHDIAGLSDFFDSIPDINHTFDSGNYLFSGEDCMEALSLFRDRITHVHLKDRVSAKDLSCPAVGTGCIPVGAIIRDIVSSGYDGWFTAEMFGNKTMLESAGIAYDNIAAALVP